MWRLYAEAASADQRVETAEAESTWQAMRLELVPETLYWCRSSDLTGTQRTRRADVAATFAAEPLLNVVRQHAKMLPDASELTVAKAVDEVAMAYAGSAELLVAATNRMRQQRRRAWFAALGGKDAVTLAETRGDPQQRTAHDDLR